MKTHLPFFLFFFIISVAVHSQSDADVMQSLKKTLNLPTSLTWTDSNPCNWTGIVCSNDSRVTRIQLRDQNLRGTLPPTLNKLTQLQILEFDKNQLTGSLPSLSGLASLQTLVLNNNNFTSIPSDFFDGMTSLESVFLDYNPFSAWLIPDGIKSASALQIFSATSANITGNIPEFFGGDAFPRLLKLRLGFNQLIGGIPASFAGSDIQVLWLNCQQDNHKLNGTIDVLQNMTQLTQVWLHGNSFSGPLPDFSGLIQLRDLNLRDNQFTGPIPASLIDLPLLKTVNISNNLLQGPTPKFNPSVAVDNSGINSFCLSEPGAACDSQVNSLLAVARSVGYPRDLASSWKGNDPCNGWRWISCSSGNVSVVNFKGVVLSGTISPSFSQMKSLRLLILVDNNLTGRIPIEHTTLHNLQQLDVSDNRLYGSLLRNNVGVKTAENVTTGKDGPRPTPTTPSSPAGNQTEGAGNGWTDFSIGMMMIGSVVGIVCFIFLVWLLVFYLWKRKQKGSGQVGNMVISIQVLRKATNNFAQDHVLGTGGFATVYMGELDDDTKIAVKRMNPDVMRDKGLDEFKSEIEVLSTLRHRHLVALLGYYLDDNERLLVYEYMPQGTLSRHLFKWKDEGLRPLEWSQRLTLALDVARGVEYLHDLAQQSFIHRDLKPPNILLGNDMRAKVSDFGLVRPAPDGEVNVVTAAGTFGYLAPEYAGSHIVSNKVDVYSFGVILTELITGRAAVDNNRTANSEALVPWFRKMNINTDTLCKAIDPQLRLDRECLASISKVAKLAGHCCALEPSHRPDMSLVVNVLSSLAEVWKPSSEQPANSDQIHEDLLDNWDALLGRNNSDDNSQNLMPARPSGFAGSFTSEA